MSNEIRELLEELLPYFEEMSDINHYEDDAEALWADRIRKLLEEK